MGLIDNKVIKYNCHNIHNSRISISLIHCLHKAIQHRWETTDRAAQITPHHLIMRYDIVSNYSGRVFDRHHLHPIPYPDREMHHHHHRRRHRRRETTVKQVCHSKSKKHSIFMIFFIFTPITILLTMNIIPESLNPVRFQSVPVPNIIGYIRWMRITPNGL